MLSCQICHKIMVCSCNIVPNLQRLGNILKICNNVVCFITTLTITCNIYGCIAKSVFPGYLLVHLHKVYSGSCTLKKKLEDYGVYKKIKENHLSFLFEALKRDFTHTKKYEFKSSTSLTGYNVAYSAASMAYEHHINCFTTRCSHDVLIKFL